jgi:signal peptidase I
MEDNHPESPAAQDEDAASRPSGQPRGLVFLRFVFGRPGGEAALVVLALLLMYLFAYRGMRFFLVPSSSMEPTLLREDQIVTLKEKTYARGDIIVLRDPEHEGDYIVKRIAGVSGDTVEVIGGAVLIDGAYLSEPYVLEPADYQLTPSVHVPEGHVFLLGDNRNDSDDSHLWERKTLPVETIIGRVRFIYFPYSRLGPVHRTPPVLADPALLRREPNHT